MGSAAAVEEAAEPARLLMVLRLRCCGLDAGCFSGGFLAGDVVGVFKRPIGDYDDDIELHSVRDAQGETVREFNSEALASERLPDVPGTWPPCGARPTPGSRRTSSASSGGSTTSPHTRLISACGAAHPGGDQGGG
ncbi:hypothetical protein GCM10010335_68320 [Streptomyces galbus]|nr:hypothetical protein GCM10010335_68320 [Streptomyces galbus]